MLLICHYCATRSAMQGLKQLVRLCSSSASSPKRVGSAWGGCRFRAVHKPQGDCENGTAAIWEPTMELWMGFSVYGGCCHWGWAGNQGRSCSLGLA